MVITDDMHAIKSDIQTKVETDGWNASLVVCIDDLTV